MARMARSFDFCSFWHCFCCLLPAWWPGGWPLAATRSHSTDQIKRKKHNSFKKIHARSLPTRCRCNVRDIWSTGMKEQINLALPTPYKTSAAMMPEVRCVEVSFIWALWRYSLENFGKLLPGLDWHCVVLAASLKLQSAGMALERVLTWPRTEL